MAHVFISYAHSDGVYARKLADHLLANGFDVWIDDRIDFGSRWIRSIFTAIDDCAAFIVIMTPRAFEREWVENERLYARKRGKIVFPLLLEGEAFPDLGATQYYDVSGGKLPEPAFLKRLAQFASRRETTGQDVAAAPQQQAKIEHETAEITKAETESVVHEPQLQSEPEAPEPQTTERAPVAFNQPEQPAASRPQRKRGSFVFAAALIVVGIAAGGIAALVAQTLQNAQPTPTASMTPQPDVTASQVESGGSTSEAEVTAVALGGAQGTIAFVSERDGNKEIYLVNADGSDPVNLTNNPADDTEPAWSTDGKRLVFTSYRGDDNAKTFIMDPDGSVRQFLEGWASWDPAWSPDGAQIAFGAYGSDSAEIFVVSADGGEPRAITNNSFADGYPAWSPDGAQIAFVSEQNGSSDIYIMDADGGNIRSLTDDAANDTNPAWSPDGSRIAFQTDRDGYNRIYMIDIDGSNLTPVMTSAGDSYEPAWSPDGSEIVFTSYRESNNARLFIVDADGSDVRRLITDTSEARLPAWRP